MKLKESASKYTLKMSLEEWVGLGARHQWLEKEAMAVPLTEELRQKMAEEKVYVLNDLVDPAMKKYLPKLGKKQIK